MTVLWATETSVLFQQIRAWCREEGWQAEEELVPVNQETESVDPQKTHIVIITPEGTVEILPAGVQYDGRIVVDMYAWPTLIRMRLLNTPGNPDWEMETDAGVPFHHAWNRGNFTRLIHDILATR